MTNENREAAELLLVNRCTIYTLLHKVVSADPCKELMDILLCDNVPQSFALLSTGEGDILGRVPAFINELRNDVNSDPGFIDKLRSEYTRLFVGPITLVAPPWESVYYGEDGMLFQESTLKVREFYRSFGLQPENIRRVPDDSLALELAFMAELGRRAVNAFNADNNEELKLNIEGSARFLREHMMVWIPLFLKRMAEAETNYMYPQICLILDAFIKADYAVLKEISAVI